MALLELKGVAKHFGAIEALKGVDLAIKAARSWARWAIMAPASRHSS